MENIDTALSHARARAPARRGFNLVEAAIVLGVVGLVIGGIWVAASVTMEKLLVNQTASGIRTAVINLRKILPLNQPDGTITYLASRADIFPSDWIKPDGSIVTPTGNTISITVASSVVRLVFALNPKIRPSFCINFFSAMKIGIDNINGFANGSLFHSTSNSQSFISTRCAVADPLIALDVRFDIGT